MLRIDSYRIRIFICCGVTTSILQIFYNKHTKRKKDLTKSTIIYIFFLHHNYNMQTTDSCVKHSLVKVPIWTPFQEGRHLLKYRKDHRSSSPSSWRKILELATNMPQDCSIYSLTISTQTKVYCKYYTLSVRGKDTGCLWFDKRE